MVGKTALNKERYHLNGGPFQTVLTLRIQPFQLHSQMPS